MEVQRVVWESTTAVCSVGASQGLQVRQLTVCLVAGRQHQLSRAQSGPYVHVPHSLIARPVQQHIGAARHVLWAARPLVHNLSSAWPVRRRGG